jgi:hypothetical protein
MRIGITRTALPGLLLMLGFPSVAHASAIPATLSIRPGPLYISYTQQDLTVVDATGSGYGWHVLASSSGSGSVSITPAGAPVCGTGSTCSLPRADITSLVTVTSRPVTIAAALPGTGMGTIVIGLAVEIAGSVTVSLQIVSGP